MSCHCHKGCCRQKSAPEKVQKMPEGLGSIIASAIIFAAALCLPASTVQLALFVAAYLICGREVLVKSLRNIIQGKFLDEHFLMSLATLGAFAIGEYPEAVAVMLFYQVGEFFLDWAVQRSRHSVRALMELQPQWVRVRHGEAWKEEKPELVQPGDDFLVKPGERVPLDGIVLKGRSQINAAALTGESVSVPAGPGAEVLSGVILLDGVLEMRALQPYNTSAVARILELVEQASAQKTPAERFITRFARWYTPLVVVAALLTAFVPPLFFGEPLKVWVSRALVFLVISCPCALVLSVPLGFFGGIGAAARRGILFKGSGSLEALARGSVMVFDKTGTLTHGEFEISGIWPEPGFTKEKLLELAAYAESVSSHPIAKAVCRAYGGNIDSDVLSDISETAGRGVRVSMDGLDIAAGAESLMPTGFKRPEHMPKGTAVFVSVNGKYAGALTVADRVKEDAAQAVTALKAQGFKQIVILTGDQPQAAQDAAEKTGADAYYASLLPVDKLKMVEKLMRQNKPGQTLLFAGDGINDAPVLALADAGIAMGGLGTDAAIEAADIVLTDDKPSKIPLGVALARFTVRIVKQNIWFALGVKAAVLVLGFFGVATLWEAVFADVGVSVLCVLNSLRPLGWRNKRL